jgi:hypothetical protein
VHIESRPKPLVPAPSRSSIKGTLLANSTSFAPVRRARPKPLTTVMCPHAPTSSDRSSRKSRRCSHHREKNQGRRSLGAIPHRRRSSRKNPSNHTRLLTAHHCPPVPEVRIPCFIDRVGPSPEGKGPPERALGSTLVSHQWRRLTRHADHHRAPPPRACRPFDLVWPILEGGIPLWFQKNLAAQFRSNGIDRSSSS